MPKAAGAAKAKKAAPARKKGANGYKMPEPIPKGEVLTDLKKQRWVIGPSIGTGGFGEIYAAAPYKDKTPTDYPAVIKIEPHGNGPLFVEMHFYMRNASSTEIENWKKQKKLQSLGMPPFLASGSHECKGEKYRFVVMERYGKDLWKLFLENGRRFPEHTVYKVAWQIINVLEYIHNRTYVHADIKGANLLLDLKTQNQVYLVDFGLASHYTTKDEYKLDPKKAHNGTIEYTSRDAHMGVPTMRGDFEILLYNMIQWLSGSLPWEKNLKDPKPVADQKEKAFANPQKFLRDCFPNNSEIPPPIAQFMNLLVPVKFNETPNYDKFRDALVKGLHKLNHTTAGKLDFSISSSSGKLDKSSVATPKKARATPKKAAVVDKSTPRKAQVAIERLDSAKKPKVPSTAASKSPRGKKVSAPAVPSSSSASPPVSLDDTLNGTIVMDERCVKGKDMRRRLLEKIDVDSEYVVQIKRRKMVGAKAKEAEMNEEEARLKAKLAGKVKDNKATTATEMNEEEARLKAKLTEKATTDKAKRGKKRVERIVDSSITDSEPEVIVKGTKSRPRAGAATSRQSNGSRRGYNSSKDMFEESL